MALNYADTDENLLNFDGSSVSLPVIMIHLATDIFSKLEQCSED